MFASLVKNATFGASKFGWGKRTKSSFSVKEKRRAVCACGKHQPRVIRGEIAFPYNFCVYVCVHPLPFPSGIISHLHRGRQADVCMDMQRAALPGWFPDTWMPYSGHVQETLLAIPAVTVSISSLKVFMLRVL